MGKSASGKDTIYKRLLEQFDDKLHPLVIHTTRPPREGEKNGVEYYFDTVEDYFQFKDNDSILEERFYDVSVVGGSTRWYYYTVKDHQFELFENLLGIGTLESYMSIRNVFGSSIVPIFIDVSDTADRLCRAIARERKQAKPNYAELCRRFISDEEDFSVKNMNLAGIDKIFYNYNIEDCVQEIKRYIICKMYE